MVRVSMVRKLAVVLTLFSVFFLASDGFSSSTTNVNLSRASGENNTQFTSGKWELKMDPSLSTRVISETRTMMGGGEYQRTTLVQGTDPQIKLDTSLGGTGADGSFDLSLGGAAGGCNGQGMTWTSINFEPFNGFESWNGPTCIINTNVKNVFNFTTVNIPDGTHIRATGSNPLKIYATGNVTLGGIISVSAFKNIEPGAGGYGPGQGPGAGQSVTPGVGGWGALPPGGSFGGVGGSGFNNDPQTYTLYHIPAASSYNTPPDRGGSGGGNFIHPNQTVVPGGAGGGVVFLESSSTIHIGSTGRIYAIGGTSKGINAAGTLLLDTCAWDCYLSGAGAGGRISIAAPSVTGNGHIVARGGDTPIDGGNWPYGSGLGKGGGGRVNITLYGGSGHSLNIDVHHGSYRWNWSYNGGSGVYQLASLPLENAPVHCTGTFISTIHNLARAETQKKWNYSVNTPSGTSVNVRVRHGSTSQYDPISWSDWLTVPSGGLLPIGGSQYIQYRADLTGTGGTISCTSSPKFGFVTVDEFGFEEGPGVVVTDDVPGVIPGLIGSASIVQNVPQGAAVKWAVSVGGGSWMKYSDGAWQNVNSISNGNTAEELTSIGQDGWRPLGVGSMRFAFAMTGNQYVTPSVSGLSLVHDPVQISAGNLNCPARLHRGVIGTCSITGSSNIGNLAYQWSGSDAVFNPTGEGTAELYFNSKGRKSALVRVYVDGHPTVSVTRTAQIEVIDTPKPSLFVEGPRSVYRGQEVTFRTVVDCPSGFQCDSELVIDGVTMPSPATLTVSKSGVMEVVGKTWIGSFQDSVVESLMKVYINEVRKPFASISAPRLAELGSPITLKATVTAKFGTPEGHWILPDGSTVSGTELVYTPTEKTDSLVIKYKAQIAGYPDTETIVESRKIKVDSYEMPQFKIKSFMRGSEGYAPSNVVLGVSGDLSKVIEFGVGLTHQWDMGDGTIKSGEAPRMVSHIYNNPGVYPVTLTVQDDRGGISVDTYQITVLEVPQLVVEFKTYASNSFSRVPINIFARPMVKGGHPQLDKIFTYEWSVNGELVSANRILSLNINEPGDYTIGLRVVSKSGKIGYGELNVTVHPNQLPVCTISHTDYPKNKVTKLTATCNDPDGRVMSYEWGIGGVTSKSANVYMKSDVSGVFEAQLTVSDDSKERATFTYPFTIER